MNDSPDDATLREILDADTIAVVGCSSTPGKDAHEIPRYLKDAGYTVIPVNPYADEIFGRPAVDDLGEVETTIDIVDVFRPSAEVGGIVESVLDRDDVETVWLQLGIRNDRAGRQVRKSGRTFVQDSCLKVEHRRLM
ncbi:CoA-binding protein [Halocatena halophila]|uniref:CoA-binding protein n=1 Tax=Halocatena halophila TaxID=2814576 RepID=UPI002ED3883C